MNRWNTLIDLEHETAYLGELVEKEAPEHLINQEFDRVCLEYFKYTIHELTDRVPEAVLSGFDDWSYEEIIALGARHNFDFAEKAGDEKLSMYDDSGFVIAQWEYFAEMLIAKECGYFPSTPEEIIAVNLTRDARRFEDHVRRERQKPRPEILEREQVFGKRQRDIKAGTIVAPLAKGKGTKGPREIQIEIRSRDRRPPGGSSKRPCR